MGTEGQEDGGAEVLPLGLKGFGLYCKQPKSLRVDICVDPEQSRRIPPAKEIECRDHWRRETRP